MNFDFGLLNLFRDFTAADAIRLINILENYIQELQYKRYYDSSNFTNEEEEELKEAELLFTKIKRIWRHFNNEDWYFMTILDMYVISILVVIVLLVTYLYIYFK